MKKNRKRRGMNSCVLKKTFRMMKLTLFCLLLGVIQLWANDLYSQQTRLSLKLDNAKIVDVLNEIENQSEFFFLYNSDDVDVKRKVDIEVNDQKVQDVLEDLFSNTNVSYRIEGRQIVLTSLDKASMIGQQKSISGSVSDSSGQPLPGVSIIIKGTTTGTITDFEGNFAIQDLPESATLVFSFVGMKTIELAVGNQSSFNIVMEEDAVGIEEVVAIGYGTKSKATLTGAISTVGSESIEGRPTANATDLLQGLAPGLSISRGNSGRLRDRDVSINIRGLTSRSDPGVLIVIDGIPQKDNNALAIDNINPDDIENISVLKDAQAAIYGARAAGGVILITTKKGKTNKPTINFSSNFTLQIPSLSPELVNVLQEVEMHNEAFLNDGVNNHMYSHIVKYIAENNLTFDKIKGNDYKYSTLWPFDNTGTLLVFGHNDWFDTMHDAAWMQNHNLSVSGKSEKANYYASLGVVDQNGTLVPGDNSNLRYFLRLKYDYQITDFLNINANVAVERQKVTEPTTYGGKWANEGWTAIMHTSHPVYNREGNYYNYGSYANPFASNEEGGSSIYLDHRVRSQLGAVITPMKGLEIVADVATNVDISDNEWARLGIDLYNWKNQFSYNTNANRNSAGTSFARSRHYSGSIYAKYNTEIKNHKFDLMVGTSHEEENYRKFSAERRLGLIGPELPTMALGDSDEQYNDEEKSDWALKSVFSRFSYDYKKKYLLEATFRYDGSSRFAEGFKWAAFYGVSAGWTISNEPFMEGFANDLISFMKLRASWGQMGNQASIGLYDHISQINIDGNYPMGNPDSPVQTQRARLAGLASLDRTWEELDVKNVGLDVAVLDNKLSANFDYFIKNNSNMFYSKEFPQVLGVTPPSVNGAHVRTKGWEFVIGWNDKVKDFKYYVNFNISHASSKVIELADSRIPKLGFNEYVEGYPAGSFFAFRYDGIIQNESELQAYKSQITEGGIPSNIRVGDARFKDLDGDGKLEALPYETDENGNPTANSGDIEYIGHGGIDYRYGINMGAEWKGFDFSAFFEGVGRWNVMDTDNRAIEASSWTPQVHYYHNTWTPENTGALYPRLSEDSHKWTSAGINGSNYRRSDAPYIFYNNKYIRLKNIQLGYTLPAHLTRKLSIEKLRLSVGGTDIWEKENLPGVYDPEKPFDRRKTPFVRGVTFGINLTI